MVSGEEELRCWCGIRGVESVQGWQGGHAGGQNDDEALGPVVGGVEHFAKVFINVASPVEANDTEVFTLSECAELAWISAATYADDGEFSDGKVSGVKIGETRAEGCGTVFDGEFIEYREAMYKFVKGVWEDHAVEREFSEVDKCQGVVVHGVGDMVRSKKVDRTGDADFIQDARFMGAIGSRDKGDVTGEVYDGSCTADLFDAIELGGRSGYTEGECAGDGAKGGIFL